MKIFTPNQLIEKKFPSKKDIKQCYEESQKVIQKMVNEQILLGATSYGSVARGDHAVNSDIDWVFVFNNHEDIFENQDFKKIIQIHKDFQVDFHPPITTLDSLKLAFNNLCIIQCLRAQDQRFVYGKDPLEVYEENCFEFEYLNAVECHMQNFYKDHLEPILYKSSYQNSFDDYVACLEKSINAANQMQIFMILTMFNNYDDEQFKISINRYTQIFREIIPYHTLAIGIQTHSFCKDYRSYIESFVSKPINMLSISEYKDFLSYYEPLISQAFNFCIHNIQIYKNKFSKKLNF